MVALLLVCMIVMAPCGGFTACVYDRDGTVWWLYCLCVGYGAERGGGENQDRESSQRKSPSPPEPEPERRH